MLDYKTRHKAQQSGFEEPFFMPAWTLELMFWFYEEENGTKVPAEGTLSRECS